MANTRNVNKVVYNNETLIDLTEDTVDSSTLQKGVVAHDKSGTSIVGTRVDTLYVMEYATNLSTTEAPDSGWSSDTPAYAEGQYTWSRAKVTTPDGSIEYSNPALITGNRGLQGEKGETGKSFTYEDFTSEQLVALKGEKGDKGEDGAKGPAGTDGKNGVDGYSPTVKATKIGKVAIFDVTDKDSTYTVKITSPSATVTKADGVATITVTDEDGTTTATVSDGETGPAGKDGADGKTPVRGTDYWTDADVAAIKAYIDEKVGEVENGSY